MRGRFHRGGGGKGGPAKSADAPSGPGDYVSGRLADVATLASGRFAMIEDGLGFRLVPWQPVLEKRLDHIRHYAVYDQGEGDPYA